MVKELKKLKNVAVSNSQVMADPEFQVRELARSSRDFIIRNDPKILALFLVLDELVEEDDTYVKGELIDIQGFYLSSEEITNTLDAFFWEKRPDNIDIARRRVWDAFQAYDKKLSS